MKTTKSKTKKVFFLDSTVDEKTAMDLTLFFADCKANNHDALIILNATSGSNISVEQIIEVYKLSKVKLTTIGIGKVFNCAAAIFCMGDERILLPNTELSFHEEFLEYMYLKTLITRELFNKRKDRNGNVIFNEKEMTELKITTRNSAGWFNMLLDSTDMKEIKTLLPYRLTSYINEKICIEVLKYFILCKLANKNPIIIINSTGGSIAQLDAIIQAYKASDMHLITLGACMVYSCAAGLFCIGDERVLLPNTEFLVHHSNFSSDCKVHLPLPMLEKSYMNVKNSEKILFNAYSEKTAITKHIFTRKCRNGIDWVLTEKEIEEYNITTKDSSTWMDILVESERNT